MFLKFTSNNANNSKYIHYLFRKCGNMDFEKIEEMRIHFILTILIKVIPIGF